METLDRRTLFRRGLAAGGGLAALGPLHALGAHVAQGANPRRSVGYGPLVNNGDLWLPEAFDYAVIQRQGKPMSDGNLVPGIFDGMAAYLGKNGNTVLIRNHENREQSGEQKVRALGQGLRRNEERRGGRHQRERQQQLSRPPAAQAARSGRACPRCPTRPRSWRPRT